MRIVRGTEVPYKCCIPCIERATVRNNKEEVKTKKRKWKDDNADNNKHVQDEFNHREDVALARKQYQQSDIGRADKKVYTDSEKGLVCKERKKKRYKTDTAFRTTLSIKSMGCSLLSGRLQNSPTFFAMTSFVDTAHFLGHLDCNAPYGMSIEDRELLDIEHKIPVEAYDFNNTDDVKRCWSPANVRLLQSKKNREKGVKIIDEICKEVGVDHFPLSWQGRIPNDAEKEEFYAKCRSSWSDEDSD
jgi:hypothetical protein